MTRTPTDRVPVQPLDPAWYYAFPTYYALLTLYGLSLTLRYAPSFVIVAGPAYARGFGYAVATVAATLIAATFLTRVHQNPKVETYLTVMLVALLLTYGAFILAAAIPVTGTGDPNPSTPRDRTAPQPYSVAIPLTMVVFPAVRVLVAVRSGALRRKGWW